VARRYMQVKAAEARLRQAEQDTSPAFPEPPEYAKQQEEPASEGGTALTLAEFSTADERQERLRIIAGGLITWREGLKVLQ
jgi:hypothetical protein